jgi:hypothetical protein
MRFDEIQYKDFLKKLGRGHSLPDDLLARYAITLPAADAEIAGQIAAVRKYWNKVYNGSNFEAQGAKMCRAEDERLRSEHGPRMETRAWWEKVQAKRSSANQESMTALADELRQSYGQLGVVTAERAHGLAGAFGLTEADAVQAVAKAGLTLIEGVSLPQAKPIEQFAALLKDMAECAVGSVPDLVHPGSAPFLLLERYACVADPAKRLDVVAVEDQIKLADKRGGSATEDARRDALRILHRALKDGVSLRDLALFHLMTIAQGAAQQSAKLAAEGLQRAGLDRRDAVVVAVLLHDQTIASGAVGVDKIQKLITSGQLNEASQLAPSLPAEGGLRDQAMNLVADARKRLTKLLAEAAAALAVPDEVHAAAVLREAAIISAEDAEEALKAVPLAPPVGMRYVCDEVAVKLFWQPAAGHDEGVSYQVSRTEQRAPAAPGDGVLVYRGQAQGCADERAPAARPLQYGVFAVGGGRPTSRPATVAVTFLPPVSQLRADVGPAEVTVHWSAHPDARAVRVTRAAGGMPPTPVAVTGNSCLLTGLTEGQDQHIEVTAIYRGLDGGELRSAVAQINATPRSEAQPIRKLRARPLEIGGAVRLRVSWTPVDNSEVRIMRSDAPPAWPVGTWVSAGEMSRFGQEVTGRRVPGRAEVAIEADVPPGVHHLVPFSIGGTGIVVGRAMSVGVTEPVRQLVITPFASHATVSWEWPTTAQLAEVSWEVDGNSDFFVIGQAQYRAEGGARVPLGRGPCTIEVRAVIMADGTSYTSPPLRQVVESVVDVAISYTVSSTPSVGPFGGRTKKVAFRCDEGCAGVRVQMVALPGRVMPTRADGAFVLLDTQLTLKPGAAVEHEVTLPRAVKRPYWVRCFVAGGHARLIDPPIPSLKES